MAAALSQKKEAAAAGSEEALIVEALIEIARDRTLVDRIEALVRAGRDAASAALQAGGELGQEFERLEDAYLRARSEDIRAVARQIALVLLGKKDVSLKSAPPGSVILADEINAFDLAGVQPGAIAGLVCRQGRGDFACGDYGARAWNSRRARARSRD